MQTPLTVLHFLAFLQIGACKVADRNEIIRAERSQALGGAIKLTGKELQAEKVLLSIKHEELEGVEKDVETFLPYRHFMDAKKAIDKSKVFAILRKLPKGATLHTHLAAAASSDYVIANLLKRDNLYACIVENKLRLHFFQPAGLDESCKWKRLKDLRKEKNLSDAWFKTQMSLPKEKLNINETWKRFWECFALIYGLLNYKPIFEEYLYQSLKELYEDNVFYVEFRFNFVELYDLNGSRFDRLGFLKIYTGVVERFKRENPGFINAKLIYSPSRSLNSTQIDQALDAFFSLKQSNADLLIGFDLVGFEDLGNSLERFYGKLKTASKRTDFFFHAGETNWYGYDVDNNLIDAILLGSKRIGHGLALVKHPVVLQMIKQLDVAIEISPISNLVLGYVCDPRDHPASALISQGFPLVLCNDDPGMWDAKGVSYDWYMAYMGIAAKDAGMGFLKQLAMNSIKYSSMTENEKNIANRNWNVQWDKFIDDVIANKF